MASFACVSSRARKALRSGGFSLCRQAKEHSTQPKALAPRTQPELSIHYHFDDCCELQHFESRKLRSTEQVH